MRALITAVGLSTVAAVDRLLDDMEQYGFLQTGPWLQIWGVKFMLDGGIESAALESPICQSPATSLCTIGIHRHAILGPE